MKKYKLMKLLPYLIVASICLLIGGGFAFISQGTSADSLRAQGLVYPNVSRVSRLTVVPVTRITYVSAVSNVVKERGKIVYRDDKTGMSLFLVSDGGLDIPILFRDDSSLLSLLKEKSDQGQLANEPHYVMAMVDDSDKSKEFLQSIESYVTNKTGQRVFISGTLLNQDKAETYIQSMKLVSYIFFALALAVLGFTAYRYSAMRRFWSQVYQALPELAEDQDLLVSQSQFKSKQLGLYLYRDYLLVLGAKERLIDLSTVLGLNLNNESNNGRLKSRLILYYDRDQFETVKLRPCPEKEARAFLEGLMACLEKHYPHILLADERLAI